MGVLERDVFRRAWVSDDADDDPRAWTTRAACLGAPLEMFFPEKNSTFAAARKICAGCPVLEPCRRACDKAERALPSGHTFGFFANESPLQRARRRGEG